MGDPLANLKHEMTEFSIITGLSDLQDMVDHYMDKEAFAFDVETTGPDRANELTNTVTWISFATDDSTDVIPIQHPNGEYIRTDMPLLKSGLVRQEKGLPLRPSDYSRDARKAIPVFGPPPEQLHHAEVFQTLKPLLLNDSMKIGQNLKFDLKSVVKYIGQLPEGRYFCTMLASWLLDVSRVGKLDLASNLERELGVKMVKGIGSNVEMHSFEDVARYSALDSYWTYRLSAALIRKLKEERLQRVMMLEVDVLRVVCKMELAGAPINKQALQELHDMLAVDVDKALGEVYRIAGRAFNMNSTQEKVKALYDKKSEGGRGLKPRKKTQTGNPSVDQDALDAYRGKDELVDAMLAHAEVDKLMSTYVIPYHGGEVTHTTGGKSKTTYRESLLQNGKIHTNFKQHGAETGRFSSSNPNLQNVPNASTEHGKAIRNLFCAPEGYVLVCADYSQVEPRIIADLTKDRVLLGAYKRGVDVYTAMINGPVLKPYKLNRDGGKLGVLAMSYGIGPDTVEARLHLKAGAGRELLDGFEKQFSDVYRYKRRVIGSARNRRPVPYVKTVLGRRRYLPDLLSHNKYYRSRAERQAFNTIIQGTAADLMKVALVRADAMLPPEAQLILTVHDELLTLCPEDMADEVAEIIREAMEEIHLLEEVDLVADVKIAKTWGEAK